MKVLIFGASGMVGRGVLLECLASPDVTSVLSVGRSTCDVRDDKLEEILVQDLFDLSSIRDKFASIDACFYCIGISSVGMSEAQYRHITFDLTKAIADIVASVRTQLTFCFVSGAGTDSTEHGRIMWARVKGMAENYVLGLAFRATYLFRPGYIQPLKGIKSKTAVYRVFYTALAPFYPVMRSLFPNGVTTTESVGRAMIRVALDGYSKPILENRDINALSDIGR